jgi:hypothetical protein
MSSETEPSRQTDEKPKCRGTACAVILERSILAVSA